MSDIVPLDPAIRNWVLLPIFSVMFMQGIIRAYITTILTDNKKPSGETLIQAQLLSRSQRLRHNAAFIPPAAFKMRKAFFVQKAFRDKSKDTPEGGTPEPPQLPQQDPLAMMGMMKQNLAMIVPNMLLMGWVSYFFSGFVLLKLPFGLTDSFKSMLQRGISLKSLDVSYVSSISWYFINIFGFRGLFTLILGSKGSGAADGSRMMQQQMQMNPMAGQVDPNAVFSAERTELEIVKHEWVVPEAENRLLKSLKK
jgi:hypothetical protein